MEPKGFGEFMRDLRQKQRLSLRKVAGQVTISVSYLWQIEKGERTPSAEILKRLAPIYDVSIEHLLRVAGYLDELKPDDYPLGDSSLMPFEDFLRDKQIQTVFRGWGKLSAAQKQQLANLVRFFEQEEEKERKDQGV